MSIVSLNGLTKPEALAALFNFAKPQVLRLRGRQNFFKDAKEKVLSSFEPDMFQMLEFDEREKKKQKFLSKAVDDGQHGDR